MPPPLVSPFLLAFVVTWAAADGQHDKVGISPVPAAATNSRVREGDEIWLVSTRHLGCPDLSDPATLDLDIRRYDPSEQWQTSSLAEFLDRESRLTLVYIHGNRYDWWDAQEYGWKMYRAIASCCGEIPPLRFVIWSWPSDKIHRPLRDIRVKAARADTEGLYLGWFMSQLKPETKVGLYGYSYGARVISSGLHVLGNGNLDGQQLAEPLSHSQIHVRAVYLSPAIDSDWLYPGNWHGDSLERVEKLLIYYNPCDPILKRYRFLDRCTRPTALGYTGLNVDALGELATRVEQYNAGPYIGRSHEEDRYTNSAELMQEVCRVILFGVR